MSAITSDLKFMVYNVENLFLLSDQPFGLADLNLTEDAWQKKSTSIFDNKPLHKCRAIASMILEEEPDIIGLCEVGGAESLDNFNRLFLLDRYRVALIEGNSDRNIDIGYLVKRDSHLYFNIHSHKEHPLGFFYENAPDGSPSEKFSRDVSELHLFSPLSKKPILITLLVHLKSRLDPEGKDPGGIDRRSAELRALIDIYQKTETTHGQPPMVVMGDFNGKASRPCDPEFNPLYQRTQLQDVCELASLSDENRWTYYQVNKPTGRHEGRQIDYAFLNPVARTHLDPASVRVLRYRDARGPLPPPSSIDEKLRLPSDHYPIVFRLKAVPEKPS